MTVALVSLLAFTGCKKESINISEEHYSLSDFTDTRASQVGIVNKNEIGLSNLKAIIRKVENSDNKYRLILKIDSVYAEVGKSAEGVPQFKMVALEFSAVVERSTRMTCFFCKRLRQSPDIWR